jgi:DNA-binding transcriptional ArsR family regulator
VNAKAQHLDRTFAALSDPTRRAMLAHLEREAEVSISDLARPFDLKLPGILKHLDVLADAGLIQRRKVGRTVTVWIEPDPLKAAMNWLHRYERFWSSGLDRLSAEAEARETRIRADETGMP